MQPETEYLVWKDGDHLHQMDLPWMIGNNPFWNIHNPEKQFEMMGNNLKAIGNFVNGRKVKEGLSDELFLAEDWKSKEKGTVIFYL